MVYLFTQFFDNIELNHFRKSVFSMPRTRAHLIRLLRPTFCLYFIKTNAFKIIIIHGLNANLSKKGKPQKQLNLFGINEKNLVHN